MFDISSLSHFIALAVEYVRTWYFVKYFQHYRIFSCIRRQNTASKHIQLSYLYTFVGRKTMTFIFLCQKKYSKHWSVQIVLLSDYELLFFLSIFPIKYWIDWKREKLKCMCLVSDIPTKINRYFWCRFFSSLHFSNKKSILLQINLIKKLMKNCKA